MLEVSFYVLPAVTGLISRSDVSYEQENPQVESGSAPGGREILACKLAEKAFRQGLYCVIYTMSEVQSRSIDDLLWTFRNTSFVPHQIVTGNILPSVPQVLICCQFLPDQEKLIVINLSDECPCNLERCERVLEILDDQEGSKQAGRKRYRHYQQLGANLTTHKL